MVAPVAVCKANAHDRAEHSHVCYEHVQCPRSEIGSPVANIEPIEALIRELSTLAPWWRGRAQPVAEAHLRAFEQSENVALCPDHRALLAQIGEPAPLPTHPAGALLPLVHAREETIVADVLGPLSSPFAATGEAPVELAWDEARDDFADPQWLAGCLPLASAGCDLVDVLVITGAERGRVWTATPSAEPQLHPSGLEFAAWYRGELERGLAPERARAAREAELEARLDRDPDDHEAAAELGTALVHRDPERAAPLLELAWTRSKDAAEASLARALAELDLVRARFDRLTKLEQHPAPGVRTLAAIGAIRSGADARGLALLDATESPALLRGLAREHEAIARARAGDLEGALSSLRRAPPGRRIVELRAQLLDADNQGQAAARERARLRMPGPTKPHAPTLFDRLAPLGL